MQALASQTAHLRGCPALPPLAFRAAPQGEFLFLVFLGPHSWSSTSLLRGAGDHLLWKMPVGLGCPLQSLLRPKAVLTILTQLPLGLQLLWPSLQSPFPAPHVHQKESTPSKACEHSRLSEDPMERTYFTHFEIFVKCCSFLSQFSDHSSHCHLGLPRS